MGVISSTIEEADAQGRSASTTDDASTASGDSAHSGGAAPDAVSGLPAIDPFLDQYEMEAYQADSDTVNQMLTAVIALANLAGLTQNGS